MLSYWSAQELFVTICTALEPADLGAVITPWTYSSAGFFVLIFGAAVPIENFPQTQRYCILRKV